MFSFDEYDSWVVFSLVLGQEETYFVTEHSDSKNKYMYSEDDIIKMLEFLVDSIFVVLPEKSSSRQSAFQWVRIVHLFSPTSFCIHTKRISYSLCSQRERNIKHLGSISLTVTPMMYCP